MPLPYDPIPRADLKLPPTATEAELQSEILLLRDSFDNADRWWREAAAEADTLRAERDALAARVERLEEALETMQRSRDRYREEWERARGREEAAARAAPSTDARGPDSAPPTA
jgi:uncharacterized coiled-coil DUF342 family protein